MTLDDALAWLAANACTLAVRGGSPRVLHGAGFDPRTRPGWAGVAEALAANRDEVLRRCGAQPPPPSCERVCRVCRAWIGGEWTPADVWRLCGRAGQWAGPGKGYVSPCPWMPRHPEVPVPADGWPERKGDRS